MGTTTIKNLISSLPKAELHLHIEGTLEPELAMSLADRNNVALPFRDLDELKSKYHFTDLQSFLDLYYQLMAVLRTSDDFKDLMLAYLNRANDDGVRHAEIFFDPQVHMGSGLSLDVVMDGLLEGLAEGHRRYGITGGLIMCIVRDLPVDSASALLETATARVDDLLGIGLDSAEVGYPPELFADVFAKAGALGLHRVAHAGEEGPTEYIYQALDVLHVERIDHGVHAVDDSDLVTRLVEEEIALTVCPLSNVRLQVVDNVVDVPVRQLLDAGIKVTINSDDPAYFGGYVAANYQALYDTGFSLEELRDLAVNSVNASFAEPARKKELLDEIAVWDAEHE